MPPALKAGVADHWWTFEDLVKLIDRDEQPHQSARVPDKAIPIDQLPGRTWKNLQGE